MKINSAHLINYKCYKEVTVAFHKWLTVLTGDSDSGKSALLHSIELVTTNRPRRANYRRKKTERTEISLKGDNEKITRIKTDKLNQYLVEVNSKQIADPKAIGADVPEIVSSTLNLSPINIQKQKDHFFLLDISEGKRAKLLNKVAGLSIVDNSIKAIKSDIKEQSTEVNDLLTQEKELSDYVKNSRWIISAEKDLDKAEQIQNRISSNEKRLRKINYLLEQIKIERKRLKEFLPNDCAKKVSSICQVYRKIDTNQEKYDKLVGVLRNQKKLQAEYDRLSTIDISVVISKHTEISRKEKQLEDILSIMSDVKSLRTAYNKLKSELAKTTSELEEMKFCHTCGRPFDE